MKEQRATMIKITETTVRGDQHEAPVDRTFQTADEAKAFLKDRLTEWYEEQGFGTEDAESESEEAWTRRGIFVTLREDGVEPLMFRLDAILVAGHEDAAILPRLLGLGFRVFGPKAALRVPFRQAVLQEGLRLICRPELPHDRHLVFVAANGHLGDLDHGLVRFFHGVFPLFV